MKIHKLLCLTLLTLFCAQTAKSVESAPGYLPNKDVPHYLKYVDSVSELPYITKQHLKSFLEETVPGIKRVKGHNSAALKTLNLQTEDGNQIILEDISDKEQTGPKGHTEQKLLNNLLKKLEEVGAVQPLIIALYTESSPCLNRPSIIGADDPCMTVLQTESNQQSFQKMIVIYAHLYEDPHSDMITLGRNKKIFSKIQKSVNDSLQASLTKGKKLKDRWQIGVTQIQSQSEEALKKAGFIWKKLDATVRNINSNLDESKKAQQLSELPQSYVGSAFNKEYGLPSLHLILSHDIDKYATYTQKITSETQEEFLNSLRETGSFPEEAQESNVGEGGYNLDFLLTKTQNLMTISEVKEILNFIVNH